MVADSVMCHKVLAWSRPLRLRYRKLAPSQIAVGRHPESFDKTLSRSTIGRRLLAAGFELQPALARDAKILVPGLDEETWWQAGSNIRLSSYHVVVRPDDMNDVQDTLMSLSSGQTGSRAGS
jgi:hypothetical protein